jgi:hypothetical protein
MFQLSCATVIFSCEEIRRIVVWRCRGRQSYDNQMSHVTYGAKVNFNFRTEGNILNVLGTYYDNRVKRAILSN